VYRNFRSGSAKSRHSVAAQFAVLQGQASWNASNVSCLKSSCIRWGSASTYWTTTRANCDGFEACGGQNCRFVGNSGPTATSPCTTPEQKCAIPYSCGWVFGRPSANALQPRNHPSGDWAVAVPPNARSAAPTNAGTRFGYVISPLLLLRAALSFSLLGTCGSSATSERRRQRLDA
jgi:hypothetical protein